MIGGSNRTLGIHIIYSGFIVSWKFWIVVLEKDGEDQLDRPCEQWSITKG